jgi:aquaporin Z
MRRYVAEGLGTYVLVLGGVGTAVIAGPYVGTLGVALAFGLSLLVMVYVIGPVSGCHVNPAVTLGLFVARKFGARDVVPYIVAQCAGAILAAGTVYLIADDIPAGYPIDSQGLAANGYGTHSPLGYGIAGAFLTETLLTGLLVLTVLGATDVRAPVGFAGIAIGFVLALDHLIAIPITRTGVNPARSLGPAVWVQGWSLSQLWLFIAAPFAGAIAAAAFYTLFRPAAPLISTTEAETALPSQRLARVLEEVRRLEAGDRETGDREAGDRPAGDRPASSEEHHPYP